MLKQIKTIYLVYFLKLMFNVQLRPNKNIPGFSAEFFNNVNAACASFFFSFLYCSEGITANESTFLFLCNACPTSFLFQDG